MRSEEARLSDARMEQQIAQRDRFFAGTFWAVILIEAGLWYFAVGLWAQIVVPLLWIGLLVHNNALLVLHELWELNDQIAGRKDELRELIGRAQS